MVALAGEADGLLVAGGVEASSFLSVGPVDILPPSYRAVVAGLAPDLAAVPGLLGLDGSEPVSRAAR